MGNGPESRAPSWLEVAPMRNTIAALPIAALACLATRSVAQTPVGILRHPDSLTLPGPTNSTLVPGVGFITTFNAIAVNDHGEWLADVTTDATPVEIADVILRNGFLTLQQGAILGKPTGALISNFRSLNIDNAGNSMWDFEFVIPPGTASTSGLFFNTKLIAAVGDPLNTLGYSRNATWLNFNGVVKSNDNNQFIVGCQVSDANIQGSSDGALILITTDDQGNVLSSFDIAHEAGQVPMLGNTIPDMGLPVADKGQFGLNNRGDVIWSVRVTGPPERVVFLNDQVLAKNGDPSPIPGITWSTTGVANARVGINDLGDWVMLGSLTAPQNQQKLLVKNGQAFLRERSTFTAITPQLVDSFGNTRPITIPNSGDPLYCLQWTGTTNNIGIMVGKEIIVRRGVTKLYDLFVDIFPDEVNMLVSSPSGRYVMFEATLEDGSQAVGLVDIGRISRIPGCVPNTGTLTRLSGFAVAGKTVTLAVDKGQGIGVTPFLLVSDRPMFTYPPCGLTTNFGELIIDFGSNGNPFLVKIGNPYVGSPVNITLPIANTPLLIDQVVYAQGCFVNIGGQAGTAQTLLLTNALEIEIGAP